MFQKKWVVFILALLLIASLPSVISLAQEQQPEDAPQFPSDIFSFLPLLFNPIDLPGPGPTTPPPTQTTPQPGPTATRTPTPPPGGTPPPDITPPPGLIWIDHNSIDDFDRIPEQYLRAASSIPMVFSDRSVGQNINEGLDCLAAGPANIPNNAYDAPNSCRRDYDDSTSAPWDTTSYTQADYQSGRVPERLRFDPDPILYNRSNWKFEFRTGEWEELLENFVTNIVPAYVNTTAVLSFQYSYLNIGIGETIADPDRGFFVDLPSNYYGSNRTRWDISDMEALEAQYPSKVFIYWTTSLARSIGTVEGMNFNNQMRQYVADNGKILFDVADILSHDDKGQPCYDNRDGVQYCTPSGNCENHPNDGQNLPAICQLYTTETDGGHLGSVSAGKIRVAKAFWVLMARIAGWDG